MWNNYLNVTTIDEALHALAQEGNAPASLRAQLI